MKLERSCNSSIIHIAHSSLNHKGVCWRPFNPSLALHLLGSDTSVKWSPVYQTSLRKGTKAVVSKNSAEKHNLLYPHGYCLLPWGPTAGAWLCQISLLLSLSECWTWQHLFLCLPHHILELHWWWDPLSDVLTQMCAKAPSHGVIFVSLACISHWIINPWRIETMAYLTWSRQGKEDRTPVNRKTQWMIFYITLKM